MERAERGAVPGGGQRLDHVGAQLLWNHWGRAWPERLALDASQRAMLDRVARLSCTAAPPEPWRLADQIDRLGTLVMHGVDHARHLLLLVGQLLLDVLRLRYKAPDDYRYTTPVILAVLLLIGLVNAASMSPLFGKSAGAVAFAVALTFIKWLILGRVMRGVLQYYGAPRLPLWGFVLVSEALIIPALAMLYAPVLALLGLFWQVWTFWVQAIGFMKMSGQSMWKVLLGYAAYLVVLMLAGSLLMMLFGAMGWLDLQSISEQVNGMMNAPQP